MGIKIYRTMFIQLRVSPTEKSTIERNATASGLQVSDYLRMLALLGMKVTIEMPEGEHLTVKSTRVERVQDEIPEKRVRYASG